jgi:diketogulonate reductase-like aldo/keto reductase
LALAWCLSRPGVTCPIVGPRTAAQLEDNLECLDVRLTPEDLARLDEIAPPGWSARSEWVESQHSRPHAYRWWSSQAQDRG